MPQTDPSGDWETVLAGVVISDTITTVRSIQIWNDGTLTFTDPGGKVTTAMTVYGGQSVPIIGKLTDVSSTVTNISLLR